jgi:hypothetical protein
MVVLILGLCLETSLSGRGAPTVTTDDMNQAEKTQNDLQPATNTIVSVEQLNPVFLNPRQPGGLNKLSALARDSLKQYPDLQPVSTYELVSRLFGKLNAGLRNHEQGVKVLQLKLPRVRQVNVYFLASENTSASWRGPDDDTGKGGIVVILPNRYYFEPQQFDQNVAGALINQPITSQDVARLTDYVGSPVSRPGAVMKRFAIETDYVDHGWDDNGDMQKWAGEAVDFFGHLQEAINYLKPRLEGMAADKRATLEQEIPVIESWLNSLGEASVTVNFGLFKGKDDAPSPRVDTGTRIVWISCKAEEYIETEQKEYRWPLWVKLMEGFNGLKGGSFDLGIAGAVHDILAEFAKDKDNKLMIAWRLNSDLPEKPAYWPKPSRVSPAP